MNYDHSDYNNESRDYQMEYTPHSHSEPEEVFLGRTNIMYQPFYNFALSQGGDDMYTNEIPQTDTDAAMLIPQYEEFQLVYIDLRWNNMTILNALFTVLGDCIRFGCESQKCQYQQSVIQQVYGDYPYMEQTDAVYGNPENQMFSADNDPYYQDESPLGFNPLNFTGH